MGASTIVGSAAFNLLVISGVSLYAVNEENDDSPERDESMTLGVKKIEDMGVYIITAISSVFAYIWMLIVLIDQNVSIVEAYVTFFMFFILIGTAYAADKWRRTKEEKEKLLNGGESKERPGDRFEFTPMEVYRELIKEKSGVKAATEED